jgi:hypothetical protein
MLGSFIKEKKLNPNASSNILGKSIRGELSTIEEKLEKIDS